MALQKPFEGKVIAITGGGSGIGLATAQYLAARGAKLSLADNRQEALETATEAVKSVVSNADVLTTVVDVRKSAQVQDWIARTVEHFGRLSGAANLAGVVSKNMGRVGVADGDEDDWDFVIDVNLKGVFLCLKAELKAIENGGSIVNASSIAGVRGLPKYCPRSLR